LMSASTFAAEVASVAVVAGGLAEAVGEALAETEADAVGFDAVGLGDGEAGVVGRGAGWVPRYAGAACGSVAVMMSTGPCSAQAPAWAEPQPSAVCSAVTVPREDDEAAELTPRVR
jgi:hypothetical protein